MAVVAVLARATPAQEGACRAALAALAEPPAEVLAGPDALARAAAGAAEAVWILEGGARPAPDALALLRAALRDDVVLACGLVRDRAGRPLVAALPSGTEQDTAAVIALARERVMPIRRATLAHTLIATAALRAHGLPSERFGAYAGQEWTTRILRDAPGRLVPGSLAVLDALPPIRRTPGAVAALVRTARTPTWTRGEALRAWAALVRPSR